MLSKKGIGLAVLVTLASVCLLATSFRRGWTQVETDFPNYYTAAVLTAHRQPLENFYNWTWFQRQMNYAGIEHQLGGYIPHTPLTMLPMIPLSGLAQQRAKQVWLSAGLLLLCGTVWILARLSGLRLLDVAALALLCYGALAENFLLGQYYLFLLFLLACAAWCLVRGRDIAGGALIGLIFALKLYTAPFALYFLVRRQWRALAGMLAAIAALALLAIAIFSFDGVWYFATTVMTRGIDGSSNDPYHPFWGSLAAFLRHTLVRDVELNPHPAIVAPAAFFFLRDFYTLGILALALLAMPRDAMRAFAWFVVVLFAISANIAEYHFVLLLVPAALLMRGASAKWAAGWLALCALVEIPLFPWDASLFPKAWLLIALFVYTGWRELSGLRRRHGIVALASVAAIIVAVLAMDAWWRMRTYRREPPQTAVHDVAPSGGNFASAPAIRDGALVYEAIAEDRYLLRMPGRDLAFDGEAFHPSLARSGPVYFELVSGGHSRICTYDLAGGRLETVVGPQLDPSEPAVSPDGSRLAFVSHGALFVQQDEIIFSRLISNPAFFPDGAQIVFADGLPGRRSIRAIWLADHAVRTLVEGGDVFEPAVSPDGRFLAYTAAETGARQIWVLNLATGTRRQLAEGACNNGTPAWMPDSRSVVFSSDCGRGMGLPALYRKRL